MRRKASSRTRNASLAGLVPGERGGCYVVEGDRIGMIAGAGHMAGRARGKD